MIIIINDGPRRPYPLPYAPPHISRASKCASRRRRRRTWTQARTRTSRHTKRAKIDWPRMQTHSLQLLSYSGVKIHTTLNKSSVWAITVWIINRIVGCWLFRCAKLAVCISLNADRCCYACSENRHLWWQKPHSVYNSCRRYVGLGGILETTN